MSKTTTDHIASSLRIFREYKALAEKAMAQVSDENLFKIPDEESNSIYLVVKHLSGNMKSRWTNFLTEDGEKPWRKRDNEFESDDLDRAQLMEVWNEGWNSLFGALEPLKEEDLKRIVHIRSEEHSVLEAINRQIAHYAYHIGQIVFLAKLLRSGNWQTLSIARGRSNDFNKQMMK